MDGPLKRDVIKKFKKARNKLIEVWKLYRAY